MNKLGLRTSRILPATAIAAGAGILVAIARRSMSGPVGNRSVPDPAKAVDLGRYVGRWYELARYENRFERNCEGVTADYAIRPDGLVEVINAGSNGADGPNASRKDERRSSPILATPSSRSRSSARSFSATIGCWTTLTTTSGPLSASPPAASFGSSAEMPCRPTRNTRSLSITPES